MQSGGLINKQNVAPGAVDFGNSTFFAYNRVTKTRGKEEFDKPGAEELSKMIGDVSQCNHQVVS